MSAPQIAKETGVSSSTVYRLMKKYAIDPRTVSESLVGRLAETYMLSKEELNQMYWNLEMSQNEIAKEIGVCRPTVCFWMKRYGIKPRTYLESKLVGTHMISKEELVNMYWDQGMSTTQIAKKIGVYSTTVGRWMNIYEIKARSFSETNSGENSPGWKGGISGGKYCYKFNNTFKEDVRGRDDYICQLCGREQLLGGRKLSIHHIHYDKENCYPDVVALCRSCNSAVNSNRDYWERYFEDLLLERGLLGWSISA
jgi:transposase